MAVLEKNLKQPLYGRDFLDFSDYQTDEIEFLLGIASDVKKARARGILTPYLQGKTLGMIFEKASTRTRVSFEVGMYELGGHALFLSNSATQIGRGEPLEDTAQVLSRYVSGLMVRTFAHETVKTLAEYATVPVINGLTDDHHPCQVLADLQTIQEHKGTLRGVTLTYVGDGNNMANSLLQAAALVGMNVRIASPADYLPQAEAVQFAKEQAKRWQSEVVVTTDPFAAIKDADVVYTDVWASMGQEQEAASRQIAFAPYQVNQELMASARRDAIFLHCLPAHRGEEVAANVIDGSQSVIFDQAENRLHAQKAVLIALLGGMD
ncbi:ornithine carbamoyltransferase [Ferroacidibacillus organovorans]|uniref:Ornithine carbamoyltransferase n=1 Tax=Ferroacidibacillus organovorans TaxID=1765683 RepID=A0A162SW13_9BACL|nr:ornithine carbamoyltransferase [Ferroacidibacillus organovorans]KYP80206.1 ornithine carbamoyltransferase [Ferroacidibacillus organovorans]OAG95032.1 ornithine carbamoyltransferase [Ferroacidibacillus organovorans]OPG17648.1 ornithine carbamoyltransferase [Ferroacidibacillus organovorans]